MRSDGFLTETACNLQFKLKVTQITLLALNVQIKNILKHHRNRICYSEFIQRSSNAVTFAAN